MGGRGFSIQLWRSKNRVFSGKFILKTFCLIFFCWLGREGFKNGFHVKKMKKNFRGPKKISGSKKKFRVPKKNLGSDFFFSHFLLTFSEPTHKKLGFRPPRIKSYRIRPTPNYIMYSIFYRFIYIILFIIILYLLFYIY